MHTIARNGILPKLKIEFRAIGPRYCGMVRVHRSALTGREARKVIADDLASAHIERRRTIGRQPHMFRGLQRSALQLQAGALETLAYFF